MNPKRSFLTIFALSFIALTNCAQQEMTEEDIITKATEIHNRVLTLDTHVDIDPELFVDEANPSMLLETRQVDIPKMEQGGLDAAFFIVYVGQGARDEAGYEDAKKQAMAKFTAIHRMTEEFAPDKIGFARTADEVREVHKSGKKVALIGIENGYIIGKDLSLLKTYYDLGARYITLAHNGHNDICDSCNPRSALGDDEVEHNGVSEFGKQVIEEMNRLGILVDVSHISHKSLMDAIALSKAPVIASHSSTKAINDVSRNISDEGLRAMRDNGGVIQIVALGSFVKSNSPEREAAINQLAGEFDLLNEDGNFSRARMRNLPDDERADFQTRMDELNKTEGPVGAANVKDFVDHIDHAVKIMGLDHVAISSDFDGGGGIVGWKDATETLNVTIELVRRGYTEEQIEKLWSGNTLRILAEAEKIAKQLQAN